MIALLLGLEDEEIAQIEVQGTPAYVRMAGIPRLSAQWWAESEAMTSMPTMIDIVFDRDDIETELARLVHQRNDIAVYKRRP